MLQRTRVVQTLSLLALLWGAAGCAGLDNMDRKIDMASEHVGFARPAYEGSLVSARTVGSMISLQFADGQIYDVNQAPATLVPGDIVRIYKTDKGYEAHLWHAKASS